MSNLQGIRVLDEVHDELTPEFESLTALLIQQFQVVESDADLPADRQSTDPIIWSDLGVHEGHCQGDVKIQYMGNAELRNADNLVAVEVDQGASVEPGAGDFASHTLGAFARTQFYQWQTNNPLVGVVAYVERGGFFGVDHPEHRNVSFRQAGWYVVRFDRQKTTNTFAAARGLQRRVD